MKYRIVGSCIFVGLTLVTPAMGQNKAAPQPAAVVNGEAIQENAVQRALKPVPAEHKPKARQEILQFLIDNTLIEQELIKRKIDASKAEVDARLAQIDKEMKAQGQDPAKILQELMLTHQELRAQITADLRWENYVKGQAADAVLTEFFKTNRDWFDGSVVRARHILVAVPADANAKVRESAKAKLIAIKKQMDTQVAKELARLDGKADPTAREQAQLKAVTEAFTKATDASDCPSKKNGGDLGLFPRIGSMVEPFAKAAFALQVGQMSDLVETQFGYHVILVTARIPGKDIKFDDVKDEVRDVYAERLRLDLIPKLRQVAQIEVRKQ